MAGSVQATLGSFDLELADDGKLESLVIDARHELLNSTDYRFDLGGGHFFVPSGWDECFPTIEPYGGSGVMGDLIGRSPDTILSLQGVVQVWRTPRYIARRQFRTVGPDVLEVRFSAEAAPEPLEFLWASHALFSTQGLLTVELPDGSVLDDFSVDDTCRRYFVEAAGPVRMHHPGFAVILETDQPLWGVWLNRGGWPASDPAGFSCIGIEATNAPGDAPQGAVLAPGGRFDGRVTLEIMRGDT